MAVKLDEVTGRLMDSMTLEVEVREPISAGRLVEFLSRLFDVEPLMIPERFSPRDPARTKYTPGDFAQLVNHDEINGSLMLMGKNRSYSLNRGRYDDRESWIFDFDLRSIPATAVADVADRIVELSMSIGTLHAVSAQERTYCEALRLGWSHGDGYSFRGFNNHNLIFGLPTLAWRTYFGPIYIQHFGKERLLSAPAYAVNEVHPDVISIQLTESIQAIGDDWDRFHATRQAVIAHLGAESFQHVRGPDDPPPIDEFDRGGVPGTSVPPELIPLRQKQEAHIRRERRCRQPTESIKSADEILAEPDRFRIVAIWANKGQAERVIIDDYRREYIRFPDAAMRNRFADALLAAGANFQDLAKHTEWTRKCRPVVIDGPVPASDPQRYNTKLVSTNDSNP